MQVAFELEFKPLTRSDTYFLKLLQTQYAAGETNARTLFIVKCVKAFFECLIQAASAAIVGSDG